MGGGLFLLNPVAPVGWLLGGFGGLLLPMGNCGARRTHFLATEGLQTVHEPILLVFFGAAKNTQKNRDKGVRTPEIVRKNNNFFEQQKQFVFFVKCFKMNFFGTARPYDKKTE